MTSSDQDATDDVDPRADGSGSGERVVALSNDLMDRSKLVAAFEAIEIVRLIVPRSLEGAHLFLVDLSMPSAVEAIEAAVARDVKTIAYGSHVNTALLLDATRAGAEALPRSVFFRRLAEGDLA